MFRFLVVTLCSISLASAVYVDKEEDFDINQSVIINQRGSPDVEYDGEKDGASVIDVVEKIDVVPGPVIRKGPLIDLVPGYGKGVYAGYGSRKGPWFDLSRGDLGYALSGIAQTSAVQASNAVSNQRLQSEAAANRVKNSYARTATGAARTAQAAVVGKQALVYNLKKQVADAERQLQTAIDQYRKVQVVSEYTIEVSQRTEAQVKALSASYAVAQNLAQEAQQAATEAANAAASQQGLVAEAKQRLANYLAQLENALSELRQTEASAIKASQAAQIANTEADNAKAAVVATAKAPEVVVTKPTVPGPIVVPGKYY